MFAIRYEEAAEEDLRGFRPSELRRIFDEIDRQLQTEPLAQTKKRKPLEGLVPPWDKVRPVWQLRVGEFRVFYDVDEARQSVVVRAIRRKGRKRTEELL